MDPAVGAHSAPVQPDATPTAKLTVGALTASFVTVLISVADTFGVKLEPDVAASLVVILFFCASYVKKSRPGEIDL